MIDPSSITPRRRFAGAYRSARRAAVAGLALSALVGAPAAASAAETTLPPLYDFLVMNVCTDASGAATSESPLSCPIERQRDLRLGEKVPYYHAATARDADAERCGPENGPRRYAYPISTEATDGTGKRYPLVVAWADYPDKGGCAFGAFGPRDAVTVLALDTDYASILGYRKVDKWLLLMGQGVKSARGVGRFTGTWSFPTQPPAEGETHFATFDRKQVEMKQPGFDLSDVQSGGKDLKLAKTIQFWHRGHFAYGAPGAQTKPLDTLLQFGFARTAKTGDAPGASSGSEHLYMTRELGYVTRWENWHRGDRAIKKDGKIDVVSRAQRAYALGNCGLPFGPEGQITPHLKMGPVTEDKTRGLYSQDVTTIDAKGREETHTWYMVGCHDFSTVQTAEPFDPASVVSEKAIGADYMANFTTN